MTTAVQRKRSLASRARTAGFTLAEILIVMVLIAVLMTGVIAGSHQLPSARLKRSATMVTSAIRTAYARANASSRPVRIVFDLDKHKLWLEQGDIAMLTQSRVLSGGAAAATEAEQIARAEAEGAVKGVTIAKARFSPIKELGFSDIDGNDVDGTRPLQRGITFRSVQAQHDEEAMHAGRAYLYFWPGGQTERASIQLRIGEELEDGSTLSVMVSPLTGKSTVLGGPVAMPNPADDKEASEREDTGL